MIATRKLLALIGVPEQITRMRTTTANTQTSSDPTFDCKAVFCDAFNRIIPSEHRKRGGSEAAWQSLVSKEVAEDLAASRALVGLTQDQYRALCESLVMWMYAKRLASEASRVLNEANSRRDRVLAEVADSTWAADKIAVDFAHGVIREANGSTPEDTPSDEPGDTALGQVLRAVGAVVGPLAKVISTEIDASATPPPGTRVGALISGSPGDYALLGYGVYLGDAIPPPEICSGARRPRGEPDPKIGLDNGDVVWGCECLWATEDVIRSAIAGRAVPTVRIADLRAKQSMATN